MVFAMVVGPSLPRFSASTRVEFGAKVVPKFARYIEVFAIITVIFGVAMVAVITDGDLSVMSPSTPFGLYISIGALLSLVAMGLAFAVVIPFEEEPPAAASSASMADIDETDSAAAPIPADPDLDRLREAAAMLRPS
jgi:hypothetical protein